MVKIIYYIGILLFLSCTGTTTQQHKKQITDSLSLNVALMPTLECLPFYYAEEIGIYKELGLNLNLLSYKSLMDCDTALLKGRVEASISDVVRASILNIKQEANVKAFMATDGVWNLMVADTLKIKERGQLKNHMVVVARNTASDWLSSAFAERMNFNEHDLFCPQINDVTIRCRMIQQHQIDAAIMNDPQAQLVRTKGAVSYYSTKDENVELGCMITKNNIIADSIRCYQLKTLINGYNKAIEILNTNRMVDCDSVLIMLLGVTRNVYDCIKLPKYKKAHLVSNKNVERIQPWLKDRGFATKKQSLEQLVTRKIIKK